MLEAILCSEGRASNVFLKCISDFSDYGEEESTAHAQICEQLADAGVFMHKIWSTKQPLEFDAEKIMHYNDDAKTD